FSRCRRSCCRRNDQERPEQLVEGDLGLAPAEPGVEAKELPGVDVAHRDQLGQTATTAHATERGERLGEDRSTPGTVECAAAPGVRRTHRGGLLPGDQT